MKTMSSRTTAYDRVEAEIPAARIDASLAGASHESYWSDTSPEPDALPSLSGDVHADLAVVGGGYSGLWTALIAKERDPQRKVVLLEGHRIGWAASSRNGGFVESSLVHGESNGEHHFPKENARLTELGSENLVEMAETIARYNMDCDWVQPGTLNVGVNPHEVEWLDEMAEGPDDDGRLDPEATREQINSPLFVGGYWEKETCLVHPAKLAWELRRVCLDLGVIIHEHSMVNDISDEGATVTLSTAAGRVHAKRVALGTNVFPSLLKRNRLFTVPVYDHALMTEPLSDEQLEAIGWKNGQGLADMTNRFHYSRPTVDADGRTRILFGGYDAVYHYGRSMRPEYDQHPETFRKLAAHFMGTFPQLGDIKFSHAWGGAIDTCSRFFAFFDKAMGGKVASAAGFTGLGVGATRFGAKVMLDLLSGEKTELTEMKVVKKKPVPFPPEPVAWIGVKLMTKGLINADRNEGKRGPFLKVMDALKMGFDS
jgi:glycine/D-amino acid oxidase-like deaminating enzyme